MSELSKLAPGQKPKENLKFPQDVFDAVCECIDLNEKIEVAKLSQPVPKKKIEQIRRDIIDLIYMECFTLPKSNFHFVTKQKLQRIYREKKKALEPKNEGEEHKEDNADTPEEILEIMAKADVIPRPNQENFQFTPQIQEQLQTQDSDQSTFQSQN